MFQEVLLYVGIFLNRDTPGTRGICLSYSSPVHTFYVNRSCCAYSTRPLLMSRLPACRTRQGGAVGNKAKDPEITVYAQPEIPEP